jgi:hypothetical protein
VLFDHAPGEFCDIGFIEIVMDIKIGFLNAEQLPMSLDFVLNVIVIELASRI